jgi:hypothetical protein
LNWRATVEIRKYKMASASSAATLVPTTVDVRSCQAGSVKVSPPSSTSCSLVTGR